MFTGIITDIGKVDRIKPLNEGVLLRIETAYDPETIELGASIACSGVCLTVVALPEKGTNARWFEVEAWEEGAAPDHDLQLAERTEHQSGALAETR